MKRIISVLLSVLLMMSVMAVAAVPAGAAEVVDRIQFGNYPKTQVESTDALEAAADAATWHSYNYYNGTGNADGQMQSGNWMQFADFFCDGVKYRAVKFTQYRPYRSYLVSDESHSTQHGNSYITNTTYYFKFEPLVWRVIDPSANLVLCENVIDAQPYQNVLWQNPDNSEYYIGEGSATYANNYASSSIRAWLNEDFYNTAFSDGQKANIKSTAINNDAYSPSYSQFDSPSTTDKIYLLSYSEAKSCSNLSINADQMTDYAICQGFYRSNPKCWLRSAANKSNQAALVNSIGNTVANEVSFTYCGVRPVCILDNLTSDTSLDACIVTASADPADGGSVASGGTYVYGATANLIATPNTGWHFLGWFEGETLVSSNAAYSFAVTETKTYTAKFAIDTFTVTANAQTGGSVNGGGTYDYGAAVTLTATPNEGWHFIAWLDENEAVVCEDAVYSFAVEEDTVLKAKFEIDMFAVSALATAGGSVTGGGQYAYGAAATLTAVPNDGFHFVGWFKNGARVGTQPACTFTVTEQVTDLTAEFAAHQFVLSETHAATCSQEGIEIYSCSCGKTQTKPLPILPHVDENNDGLCDVGGEKMTGDGRCEYCGQLHEGFAGFFIGFFHKIAYFFAHLFGQM